MTSIPNLSLLYKLLEPPSSHSLELDDGGRLVSPSQGQYSAQEAETLSQNAGRELGNMLADLRNDFGRQGQDRGPNTNFQERKDEIKPYQVDMMVNAFGAFFITLDRVTRLQMKLDSIPLEAQKEQTELLASAIELVRFLEDKLIAPFIKGFGQSDFHAGKTKTRTLADMCLTAYHVSNCITEELQSNASRETQIQLAQAREAAIDRIFTPYLLD